VSFTLDPEVAEAFAPFAAEAAGSTPPPVGDVATRRATGVHVAHRPVGQEHPPARPPERDYTFSARTNRSISLIGISRPAGSRYRAV
jgi:hypothetical protein